MIFETQRLILREFLPEDAEALYQLNADPDVVRHTGDVAFADIADAARFLSAYNDYRCNGYGRWAMVEKSTGTFVGWCGLKFHADSRDTDIGFRLFKKYWNQGFATEAARACLDYGFKVLGLPSVIGRAVADNSASIRVLEKIGLRFEAPFDFHGKPGVIYRVNRP
jgi:[ribosomal protein S5]-alanine N-acetyltransferase